MLAKKDDKYEPIAVRKWRKIYALQEYLRLGFPMMMMQANTHYINEKSDIRDMTYGSWAGGKMKRLVLVCPGVTVAANSGSTLYCPLKNFLETIHLQF